MNYRILSDKPVLHRADTQGTVITRVQIVEVDGRQFRCEFWSNWQTQRLARVTSTEVR